MNALDFLQQTILPTIKAKKKNWLLKIFVPKNYAITIGHTFYTDDGTVDDDSTVIHEAQHMIDQCYMANNQFHKSTFRTIWFYMKYTFPHNLSILSIIAMLFGISWYFSILWLLLLIPNFTLSFNRKNYELRGYFWNWYIATKLNRIYMFPDSSKIFNSWTYFKMDSLHSEFYYHNIYKSFLYEISKEDVRSTSFLKMKLLKQYVDTYYNIK